MQFAPPTILIIEPYPILREGMVGLLTSTLAFAEVEGSAGFQDALPLIRDREIDLVITDFRFQHGDVLPLLENLSASGRRTRCLIISALDEMQFGYPALRAGASGFIAKAAPVSAIIDAIRMILDGHTYCSDRLARSFMSAKGPEMKSFFYKQLTPRELQVFQLVGECFTVSRIAAKLGVSVKTVESHRENIKNKLGCQNSAEVTAAAVRWLDDNSVTI